VLLLRHPGVAHMAQELQVVRHCWSVLLNAICPG
jgi:hypothetical protein